MSDYYPLFRDIKNPKLRAWNRLNIIYNMKEQLGSASSRNYVKQFNKRDKFDILDLGSRVVREGYEDVRRSIIRELNAHG